MRKSFFALLFFVAFAATASADTIFHRRFQTHYEAQGAWYPLGILIYGLGEGAVTLHPASGRIDGSLTIDDWAFAPDGRVESIRGRWFRGGSEGEYQFFFHYNNGWLQNFTGYYSSSDNPGLTRPWNGYPVE